MHNKWVIFDAMGVIFEVGDDTNKLLVPFIQKRNSAITSEKINAFYLTASLGNISSYSFWAGLGFKSEYPQIEREYLDTCLTLNKDLMRVAEQLSLDYSLAILSNDVKEWSRYLRSKFDLDRLFEVSIISGEVNCRKPDINIYNKLLKTIKAQPEECCFIDDRLKNLQPATKLGLKTIWFNEHCPEGEVGCGAYSDKVASLLDLTQVLQNFADAPRAWR